MPYGGVNDSAADLNQIPASMVERVEVLTGGASAVYGSDAVAGVVNFIMKKDFEGVEFEAQYGFYQHENDFEGPGDIKLRDQIAASAATNPQQFALPDDNVTDGAERRIQRHHGRLDGGRPRQHHGLRQRPRQRGGPAARPRLLSVRPGRDGGYRRTSFTCSGSSTSFPGRFTDFGANNNGSNGPDGVAGTADDVPDTNPLPSFNFTIDSGDRQHVPALHRCATTTTSVRSISTSAPTPATRWVRWAITSSPSTPTSTRSSCSATTTPPRRSLRVARSSRPARSTATTR